MRIAAASSLARTFDALAPVFLSQTGLRLAATYASTTVLLRQISQGAPYDLFATADAALLAPLERDDALVAGTRRTFARGRVVLYLAPHVPHAVQGLEGLRDPSIRRIAIASPTAAPYGRAAVEALRALHQWEALVTRIVEAPDVRAAYQYAASGNTDAAFTARSVPPSNGPGRVYLLDAGLHAPIEQAIALVRAARNPSGARAFVDLLFGPTGRDALRAHGLEPTA